MRLSRSQQHVLDRFVEACERDERVVAAFLGGSYAGGTADEHSDLDFGLITTDEAYKDFYVERDAFIRLLGEPALVEDFDLPDVFFFIFSDGTECELAIGRERDFAHIHSGPYRVLVDKRGVLNGVFFPPHEVDQDKQTEALRRRLYWFWHDLSHFITAMARGQLWWAYGQLDELRLQCVDLARLRHDFSAETQGYEKVEKAVPVEHLAPLRSTFCPMERDAMLQAGLAIIRFYKELAPGLAQTHGLTYPEDLQRVMCDRLERLS